MINPNNNISSGLISNSASFRKIGENALLRPFLSALFDPQVYVKNIIRDGKSEECFEAINECVNIINEEIQEYISSNKDILMSGMHDIASLGDRYNLLAEHSKNLQSIIQRLKKEINDSHSTIKAKTYELERIHETNSLLLQVKQFVKSKAHLDQYLKNTEDKDPRSLASIAKTISELEKLVSNSSLLEIQFIREQNNTIKTVGNNIRKLAQSHLFEAIYEKNQASIANYLQVFYNFDSLPEIILSVIDEMVKLTMDASREALNMETLNSLFNDYTNKVASTPSTSIPSSATKHSSTVVSSSKTQVTLSQLRLSIREMTHAWSNIIYDRATQILVLQRVIAKKEDPSSHEKFSEVLKRFLLPFSSDSNNNSSVNNPNIYKLLQKGQLIDMFWFRCYQTFQDICQEKLQMFPNISIRSYPYLRKAANDVVQNIIAWTQEEQYQLYGSQTQFIKSLSMSGMSGFSQDVDITSLLTSDELGGQFGSLLWSSLDLLQTANTSTTSMASSLNLHAKSIVGNKENNSILDSNNSRVNIFQNQMHNKQSLLEQTISDHDLVNGLKPLRDRYLIHAFDRMSFPIRQMFPELEGYTAAIPSKRDLQTLFKSIQQEYLTLLVESDEQSLCYLTKEFHKVIVLFLTKIEQMILHTPESRKIFTTSTSGSSSANQAANNISQFQRTSTQEHNGQLFLLLHQLKESLEKLPSQLIKQYEDLSYANPHLTTSTNASDEFKTPGKELTSSRTTQKNSSGKHMIIGNELEESISLLMNQIDDLSQRQIIETFVTLIATYCHTHFYNLYKEGIVHPNSKNSGANSFSFLSLNTNTSSNEELELSSNTVQLLIKQYPMLIKTYLLVLPKGPLIDKAIEELSIRILQGYISIAALVRPVNEATRMRSLKDLTALENMLTSYCNLTQLADCPVMSEFQSFRRLLFPDKEYFTSHDSLGLNPPKLVDILKQEYVNLLRPTTLLGYLMANAPNQLPLPIDLAKETPYIYLDDLLNVPISSDCPLPSSRSLYKRVNQKNGFNNTDNSWKRLDNERKAWERIQEALDIFFQRISAVDGDKKAFYRGWYESILDIGSHFFK